MEIENLNKDLDTEAQKAVKGGTALTGQVVPTNVQSNALEQAFHVGSQSNESDQDSIVPVGSLIIDPLRSTILK
jgi:hypothetical protein